MGFFDRFAQAMEAIRNYKSQHKHYKHVVHGKRKQMPSAVVDHPGSVEPWTLRVRKVLDTQSCLQCARVRSFAYLVDWTCNVRDGDCCVL